MFRPVKSMETISWPSGVLGGYISSLVSHKNKTQYKPIYDRWVHRHNTNPDDWPKSYKPEWRYFSSTKKYFPSNALLSINLSRPTRLLSAPLHKWSSPPSPLCFHDLKSNNITFYIWHHLYKVASQSWLQLNELDLVRESLPKGEM